MHMRKNAWKDATAKFHVVLNARMLAVLADAGWVVQVVEALTVLLDVEEMMKWAQHFEVSSVGVAAVYTTVLMRLPTPIPRTSIMLTE